MSLASFITGSPYALVDPAGGTASGGVDQILAGGGVTVSAPTGAVTVTPDVPKWVGKDAFNGASATLTITVPPPTAATDLVFWQIGSTPVGTITFTTFGYDGGGNGNLIFTSTSSAETAEIYACVWAPFTAAA